MLLAVEHIKSSKCLAHSFGGASLRSATDNADVRWRSRNDAVAEHVKRRSNHQRHQDGWIVRMIPFYKRSLDERLSLTSTAIHEKRTLIERWEALDKAEAKHWSARAAAAARYLRGQSSVADFGCGTMTLANHLQPDQRYIPVDVVARDDRTLVCDLNTHRPPETGAASAAFLGVFEYIYEPLPVLQHLNRHYGLLVMTYCITDAPKSPTNRREHGWVNDFSEGDVLSLFERSGWVPDEDMMVDRLQKIWRLTPAPAA